MTTRAALSLSLAVALAGMALLGAAALAGSYPAMAAGAVLGIAGLGGVWLCAARHLVALARLRDTVVMLLADDATMAPESGAPPPEVRRLRDAIEALLARRLERRARPDDRLAAVLGSIAEAIVVTTDNGQVSMVNGAARQLLGDARVAVGTSLYAALSRSGVEKAVAASRAAGRPVGTMLRTVDGEELEATVAELAGHGGAVLTFPLAALEHHARFEYDLTLHDAPPPAVPPDAETALAALPVLVFDCETTGLDVKRDVIVSLGGVRMTGARIYRSATIDRLVNPQRPIPPRSTAIHGITDAMVADAPPFEACWPDLEALMRDVVLVGHNIAFDIAHLRAATRRCGIEWTPPRALDTLLLTAALEPDAAGFGLEAIAERFGVSVHGRHTALGDSLVTAEIFARLLPRLEERGVTTLGAAEAFARRARAFVRGQRQSGWFDDS